MEKSKKPHIVFFTPSLQRTGSELVLFNFLPFIKDDFEITVIAKYKGELYGQLPSYVRKDYLYASFPKNLLIRGRNRLLQKFQGDKKLNKYKDAIWYVNTIVLPDIVAFAAENKIPVIMHLHELAQMYALLFNAQIERLVKYPFLIIANSQASASVVKEKGRAEGIEICYPAIDKKKIIKDPDIRSVYRKKLGIKEDEFVWVMSGTIDPNKNPLLFIDLAVALKKANVRKFKCVWLGGAPDGGTGFYNEAKEYVKSKDVEDAVVFTGSLKEEFRNYFLIADGFVLTSQFESFSLVTLEAMLLGLPIVANDCGGVKEILDGKFGYVLRKKNDVKEMIDQMMKCMQQSRSKEEITAQISSAGRFDIKIWGNKWREILINAKP